MKDVALVYTTKYGHTKQYADWLKEELDIEVKTINTFNAAQMLSYKLVIFASGVYNDKIQIMDFIKKQGTSINPSRIMIAAVTWFTNESEDAKPKLIEDNYPENFKNVVPLVILNSGINKKQINVMEKAQITAASLAINKHEERTSDDINALAIIKGYADQTSKDNIKYLKEAIDKFLNPPKKVEIIRPAPQPVAPPPPKPVEQELKQEPVPQPVQQEPTPAEQPSSDGYAELKGEPSQEESTLNSVENAFNNLKAKTVPEEKPAAPAPSGSGPVVASLDDALAALNSGNMFAKAAPTRYSAAVEKHDKPKETPAALRPTEAKDNSGLFVAADAPDTSVLPENADDIKKPAESGLFVNAGEADTSVLPENADDDKKPADSALFVHAGEADTSVLPENADDVKKPADTALFVHAGEADTSVLPENADDVKKPADSALFVSAGEADTSTLPENADAVKPALGNHFVEIEVPELDDFEYEGEEMVMSISEDLEEVNKAVEEAAPVKPEPVSEPRFLHRPEPVKAPEPAAPKKNSYLEYFSKRNKAAEPAAEAASDVQQSVSEPAPVPQPEPVSSPQPAPKPAPVVNSAIDDFDFDILGNESSTATGVSSRALNAVNALAKAKAEGTTPAQNIGSTYDVINNSLNPSVTEQPARAIQQPPSSDADAYDFATDNTPSAQPSSRALNAVNDLAKAKAEAESALLKAKHEAELAAQAVESDYNAHSSDYESPSEYGTSEFIADPAAFEAQPAEEEIDDGLIFSNDADYDLNDDIAVEETAAAERDPRQSGAFDFKKLQQEIEESIEVNKRKKERDILRNTRELDRNKPAEEEGAKPVKRMSEPLDPDLFFKRAGKDYYESDTMPEIRFDRRRRN